MSEYVKRTAEEIEDTIFGSGFSQWPWWESVKPVRRILQNGECVDWEWEVTGENPDEDGHITKRLTPADIIKGIECVERHKNTIPYMSAYTIAECENFLYGYARVDFDADTADQVMQLIMFGAVHYG